MTRLDRPALLLVLALTVACRDPEESDAVDTDTDTDTDTDSDTDTDTDADTDTYAFDSAFVAGSSVAYDGQILRQLLIDDMKTHVGGLTARIDTGVFFPAPGDVTAEIDFYFAFDSDAYGTVEHQKATALPALQTTYDDVSVGKDLVGKIAGNDAIGQHEDWSVDLVGWEADGVTTPESLVRHWAKAIDDAAVARSNGDIPLDPSGAPIGAVYLDAEGRNYQELLEKFLRGSVAYSQGTDDYLDDDLAGKGLDSDHTAAEEGKPFTALEHGWDEGFGYFGASATYGGWTDTEISTGNLDVDGDGRVDLLTEVAWGHSGNAGKRDAGAIVATDFSGDAWTAFHAGRDLLSRTAGQGLTAEERVELAGYRDDAVGAWEKAIASSVVHYINEVLHDMAAFDTDGYAFADHAKHWSELKGFALSLQFNPRSTLSDEEIAGIHAALGTAPALPTADAEARAAYRTGLLDARALIGLRYGFDAANLGDDNGENGW